jgi:hypothetical protein
MMGVWNRQAGRALLAAAGLLAASVAGWASAAQAEEGRTVVLDTTGFWRMHHTLKPPVVQMDDGPKPVLLPQAWLNAETPEPPADWMMPDFDDSQWVRGPARLACKSPYLARLCMRGKFLVSDPAQVKGLCLSAVYQGGIVVYLNGQEVQRADLPPGSPVRVDAARPYPLEAYVNAKGDLMGGRNLLEAKPDADRDRRYAMRERSMDGVAIPTDRLRAGVNVLALEIVRAPYDKVVEEKKNTKNDYYARLGMVYQMCFNTCEFGRVQLTAEGAGGLVPDVTRPQGFQVWNSSVLASDYDLDFGDPCEKLRPVEIVGARNGAFNGKFVVGSTGPIEGLKVTPAELRGPGVIPASAVRVRYGIPWGEEWGVWGLSYGLEDNKHWRYPREPDLLDGLADAPLDAYPVRAKPTSRYDLQTPNQPGPVFGSVVPVWLTVQVPADVAPGAYEGVVAVSARGVGPLTVPVRLEVQDYVLPCPQDYRTWVELVQSPDTLSVEYGLDLWSPRHWEMIARSMSLLNPIGSRVLYVPLIAQTNLGNEHSMVYWIDRGQDRYEYDFSVMDRYLDTAEKFMGKPKVVVLGVWEVYMIQPQKMRAQSEHDEEMRTVQFLQEKGIQMGSGPVVTVLDPVSGRLADAVLPRYDSEAASKEAWSGLFAQVRQRLAKRGLEGTMMLGDMSDAWPTPQEARFLKEVSGDVPWVSFSHINVPHFKLHDVADVGYSAVHAMGRYAADDQRNPLSLFGWKRPELYALYDRTPKLENFPITRWRHFAEACITGDLRGMGRIGADFWQAMKNRDGRRQGTVADRYPQSTRRNLNIYTALLAPGPDGPIATARFEAFREGVQECEARIVLEQALTDEALRSRLPAELLARIQQALEERTRMLFKGMSTLQLSGPYHIYAVTWKYFPVIDGNTWYLGSGWQDRSRLLFSLAGEVHRILAAKPASGARATD